MKLNCFKKYDVRGVVGEELTPDIATSIGAALAIELNAETAVVGGDARESTPRLKQALINGLVSLGIRVFDIGETGTEEVYFACQELRCDLGVEITASHNPIEYNGIKFVASNARPLTEQEFNRVRVLAEGNGTSAKNNLGVVKRYNHIPAYISHLLSYISPEKLRPLKLVVNAGNGVAGHIIDEIEVVFNQSGVPVEFVKINHLPDSTFPNGIPNPLLPEGRADTIAAVKNSEADFGVAWDGDFDRCFFFDENGEFVDGYYIVGLLAKSFMLSQSGIKVVHDPRVFWNTHAIAEKFKGEIVKSKTGHALIKARMREVDAIYGGEMSAHHYFRSFGYCDSGMIPWLLMLKLLSENNSSLSQEVALMKSEFPASGEINFKVANVDDTLTKIEKTYAQRASEVDMFDGLSMTFAQWRFNLRGSATEPLLRLNVETRGDTLLLSEKVQEITALIEA